ncbi:MAG: hypothetical protein KGJ79_13980 [Alphaproteobacteria bacterium]|nr:hypothetical protein [Alphaproteobacteria bacterium]MDE2112249.1 hypothetical protein [Alphaproteobacteria bacterium]MDE2494181.1 hypothetical protein [Alphaproteobacteria bacterium]
MNAFFKTLFGDFYNLAFVGCVVAIAALMVHFGQTRQAVYVVPVLLLAGTTWFARR